MIDLRFDMRVNPNDKGKTETHRKLVNRSRDVKSKESTILSGYLIWYFQRSRETGRYIRE